MPTSKNQYIYNLKELITSLSNNSGTVSFKEILNKIRFSYKEMEPLCFWDSDNITEINIDENDQYNLKLICWEKGQQTTTFVNNHNEAWIYVLKGELIDEVYEETNENNFLTLSIKNLLNISKSGGKHKLSNAFDGRSVSLHLYIS